GRPQPQVGSAVVEQEERDSVGAGRLDGQIGKSLEDGSELARASGDEGDVGEHLGGIADVRGPAVVGTVGRGSLSRAHPVDSVGCVGIGRRWARPHTEYYARAR